jgi:hypothetical protein
MHVTGLGTFLALQLAQFVHRTHTKAQALKAHDEAYVTFPIQTSVSHFNRDLEQSSRCRKMDWQLLSLAQIVCASSSPLFSTEEHHHIDNDGFTSLPRREDDIENDQWLDLSRPFPVVKNLYFSWHWDGVVGFGSDTSLALPQAFP